MRAAVESITDPEDLADVQTRYDRLQVIAFALDSGTSSRRTWAPAPDSNRIRTPGTTPTM
jgi:hypothetical protein